MDLFITKQMGLCYLLFNQSCGVDTKLVHFKMDGCDLVNYTSNFANKMTGSSLLSYDWTMFILEKLFSNTSSSHSLHFSGSLGKMRTFWFDRVNLCQDCDNYLEDSSNIDYPAHSNVLETMKFQQLRLHSNCYYQTNEGPIWLKM